MPLRVRDLLEKFGDEPILKIQLGRTPVQDFPLQLLDFLSHSRFSDKKLELGYDELYHNYLLITIKDSNAPTVVQHMFGSKVQSVTPSIIFKLEKAQRIALIHPPKPEEFVDIYDIPLTPDRPLTLNRLLSTASNFDEDFYIYDAAENNMCQTFVENIIQINGLMNNITDKATLDAIKPIDAKTLIATLGNRSNIVKMATDCRAKLDKLLFDRKIVLKKSKSKQSIQSRNSGAIYNAILELEKSGKVICKT